MTPERWHQIDKLLEAALDLNPSEWPTFLEKACAEDNRLREEILSILQSLHGAEGFLEKPPAHEISRLLSQEQTSPPELIGPYRILDLLGRGGMGEVYRATDTRLDRKVAIKVLPAHLSSDPAAMKLLRREAKAIAALNHPNILAIYEFDTTDAISFVVTELLEGETLRVRIAQEPLEAKRALEIAMAVAEGLSEVPAPLREIVSRCLRKEPVQRFASAQELLGALKMASSVTEPVRSQFFLRFRSLWVIAAVFVLAVITAGVLWMQKKSASVALDKIDSVAVLPLQNLSGNSNQEYLVDGMTDELIAELSKIKSLKVISRTSSMQYKEAKKPLPEIARKLNVDALVEGSVAREGDQIRITVQLIHGATDRHLWAQSYQRQMQGVLALQGEVAQAIAREIQAQLTPQEQKRLSDIRPVNSAAHEAYLKAMYYYHESNTVEEFQKGFHFIQQAVDLDPQDALIQATLGRFYLAFGERSIIPSAEAYTKANEAALRAVELDDNLAEAHQTLGRVHHHYTSNKHEVGIHVFIVE